ncbi:hypothetical protein SAMN05421786_101565 [Chryseobacterium ureilyticum]|uniref:Uncharacterized protein n=1 Tax=Chryseobacterium ureilyticum TaxID=373668 RepID=A0A1N7KKS3_9FLAO|nr:hypothetical protein [Chryseobacterium ureilyticum]SIS62212.1 hypothetical protein SAMN05421786_101565 [Chryseobacterium ureilyticum]
MEVIYNISIEVSISNIEAGLLYKYLKMHPVEKQYINYGYFAFSFKEFEQKREFDLTLTMEIMDSCVRVLEDQDLGDPVENLLKKELLEKIYKWSAILYGEEDAIEVFQTDYYLKSIGQLQENNYFSFRNYLKLRNLNS